jgi:hypothetical protein
LHGGVGAHGQFCWLALQAAHPQHECMTLALASFRGQRKFLACDALLWG